MNYTTESLDALVNFKRGDVFCQLRCETNRTDGRYLIIDEPTYPYVKVINAEGKSEIIPYTYLANERYFVKAGHVNIHELTKKIGEIVSAEINSSVKGCDSKQTVIEEGETCRLYV